jgi:hypothetical protein
MAQTISQISANDRAYSGDENSNITHFTGRQ